MFRTAVLQDDCCSLRVDCYCRHSANGTATSVTKVEAIPLNVKLDREGSEDKSSCVKVTVQLPSKAILCLV